MAERDRADIDAPSICVECGGTCHLERNAEPTRTQLRCTACHRIVEVVVVAAAAGTWTLVAPDGNTARFSSWQELMMSLRAIEDPRVARSDGRSDEGIEEVPDEDVVPASEESKPARSRTLPPVHVSLPPPLPPGASMRIGSVTAGMTLSFPTVDGTDGKNADSVTVGSEALMPVAASRAPTLDTLYTLDNRDDDDDRNSDTKRHRAPVSDPPPPPLSGLGAGWIVPVVSVAALVIGIWYMTRTPAVSTSGDGPLATATQTAANSNLRATATSTSTGTSSAPMASTAPPTSSGSASSDSPTAASDNDLSKRRAVGDLQLSLPEVLERAAVARKSGDAAHARSLLERAIELSPGNAEAYGLLADLARSQGDNAGAKASYEKALAIRPSYLPAFLGLADTQWDLGERDAAQRHYAAIVALGRPVSELVKERATRGGGAAANTAPTKTTPASATATTAATTVPTVSIPAETIAPAPTAVVPVSTAAPPTAAPAETSTPAETPMP